MALDTALVTASELWSMPDDGQSYDLVRGELLVMSKPGPRHGRITANITSLLWEHARKTKCGTVLAGDPGFQLESDPDTVRAPDVAFVSAERMAEVGETTKFWPGAPDLAVEVVSPNDRSRMVREKAIEWLVGGATAVLVIDPAKQTATVYRPNGDAHVYRGHADVWLYGLSDTLDLDDVVPGFSVPVAELFS